jgi:manganese-dependent inorganic pyrophosphatase
MEASCLIVSGGAVVSKTIKGMAQAKGCVIITTPCDTFAVARLIHQSMPVAHFMLSDHINIFHTSEYIENVREIMAKNRTRDFPVLDRKGHYKGMISRRNLLNMGRKSVILVDHNERNQAVDGIETADILEIIDHHRLGTIETIQPVYFRNQPLGCTATIVYLMFVENALEIDRATAGLLCAAIISDTLMFRSPTCTDTDRQAAQALATIAGIQIEAFAHEMFAASSDMAGKSIEELFYQDFKTFSVGEKSFAVGQITSVSENALAEVGKRIEQYIDTALREHTSDMMFFMLTNIIGESTDLVCAGDGAASLIATAFGVTSDANIFHLPGMVSRKKQFVPVLMNAMVRRDSDSDE